MVAHNQLISKALALSYCITVVTETTGRLVLCNIAIVFISDSIIISTNRICVSMSS